MLNGTTCVTAPVDWIEFTIALNEYVPATIVPVGVSPIEYFIFTEEVAFWVVGASTRK